MLSRKALGCLGTSGAFLVYTWYTKPNPYPPLTWSKEAREFPDHISAGLGPFQYYCPEQGAVSNPEDPRLKPGLDAPASGASGIRMMCAKDYTELESRIGEIRKSLTKRPLPHVVANSPIQKLGCPVTVTMKRNLSSMPFSSIITMDERREVERLAVEALGSATYHSYIGSRSIPEKQMSPFLRDVLRSQGLLFEAPWTVYDLSCGSGRHWPDARGVSIVDAENSVCVWVNGEDHVEIVAVDPEGDVIKAAAAAARTARRLEATLPSAKQEGYLTMKPENSGLGIKIFTSVSLPFLSRHPKFASVCSALRIRSVLVDRVSFVWNLMSFEQVGLSEEECAERTAKGISKILEIEKTFAQNTATGEDLITNLTS